MQSNCDIWETMPSVGYFYDYSKKRSSVSLVVVQSFSTAKGLSRGLALTCLIYIYIYRERERIHIHIQSYLPTYMHDMRTVCTPGGRRSWRWPPA